MSSISVKALRAGSVGLLAVLTAIAGGAGAAHAEPGVVISSGKTENIGCKGGLCIPFKKAANLNVADLQALLASGNVTITTNGAKSLDIIVDANVSWASPSSLTLDAYRAIVVDKSVTVDGTGDLTLTTNDGGTGGTLSFGKNGQIGFLSTTSAKKPATGPADILTINGTVYTLVADTTTLASDIAANPSGDYALAGYYNASGNPSSVTTTFNGRFEGLGNTISHLGRAAGTPLTGLFSEVGVSGTVADLRLAWFSSLRGGRVGALASGNQGTLFGDSASGKISVASQTAGGLVAVNSGAITNCFSLVDVGNDKKSQVIVGGLVGTNSGTGTIANSYAAGSVFSNGNDQDGGLVGLNLGTIANSYASGSVVGLRNAMAGGLVGFDSLDGGSGGTIVNSYASGPVAAGTGGLVGGLIGYASQSGGMTDTYWDIDTTGEGHGAGNISADPGITGLSNTQLQSGLPAGFDSAIWGENATINGGLPYLLALPPK